MNHSLRSNDGAILVLQDSTSEKRLLACCRQTQKVRGQTFALMHLLGDEVIIKLKLDHHLACPEVAGPLVSTVLGSN